jgi:hypothetical protein
MKTRIVILGGAFGELPRPVTWNGFASAGGMSRSFS